MKSPAGTPVPLIHGPLIDSHLHLVNLDRFHYYWMKPEFSVLQHNYLAEDVHPLYEACNVDQAVLVQAHPSREETRYLVEVANMHRFVGAVVAYIDLTAETIEQDLAELSRSGIIRAIRHQQAEDQPGDWFLGPEVLRGLRAVSAVGLSCDLLVKNRHLYSIPVIMEKVPDLKIVLEHMGKPPIASGSLRPWAEDLAAIAENPAVCCKISELVTQADWERWSSEDLKPYVQHALKCFGPDRLMWGSGWPVCLLAADFGQTLSSSLEALGPLSEPDIDRIFRDNARAFYDLDSCHPARQTGV
jgi:L-fuconolactonase